MPKLRLCLFPVIVIALLCSLLTHYLSLQKCLKSKSNSKVDQNVYKLIILILSAPENVEQRNTIRKTWLSKKSLDVKSYFAIGLANLEPEQKFSLQSENQKYLDLLFINEY